MSAGLGAAARFKRTPAFPAHQFAANRMPARAFAYFRAHSRYFALLLVASRYSPSIAQKIPARMTYKDSRSSRDLRFRVWFFRLDKFQTSLTMPAD